MVPETQSSMNPSAVTPLITRHPDGIFAVDAQYLHPGHAAVHIIQQGARAAIVDTGANSSIPHVLAALDQLGIAREAVEFLFLTHVHLDHAGGAGTLMQALPNARAYLHPRGVPHMLEPSKLIAGSKAVYGDEAFQQLYGDIVPISADRIVSVTDGQRVRLGDRSFELIHTPGHALHHYAIVDPAHASIFTGDTFGVSYREMDTAKGAFILPTTSPSQFDPEQLIASIDRLMSYAPTSMYLMHYSRVTDVPRLARQLKWQIGEFVRIARENGQAADAHEAICTAMLELWLGLLEEHGSPLRAQDVAALLEGDLELNAQGLLIWLHRRR